MSYKPDRTSSITKPSKLSSNENLLQLSYQESANSQKGGKEITHRVNIIEQNLNRVCLQQDALMPLLNLLDFVPIFQKNDGGIKSIYRRLDEYEQKQNIQLHQIQMDMQGQNSIISDKAQLQIEQMSIQMSHMDASIETLQTQYNIQLNQFEDYIKEEKNKIMQQVQTLHHDYNDTKLTNNKNELSLIVKKLEIQQSNQDKDLQNIYRELEGLKNEYEFIEVKKIQKVLTQKLQELPNLDQDVKLLALSTFEVERTLQEMQYFDHVITLRFQTQLKEITNQSHQPHTSEKYQELVRSKVVQIKYQIAACKMKYFKDFEKIQKIQTIIANIQLSQDNNPALQLQAKSLHSQVQYIIINQVAQKSKANLENVVQIMQTLI